MSDGVSKTVEIWQTRHRFDLMVLQANPWVTIAASDMLGSLYHSAAQKGKEKPTVFDTIARVGLVGHMFYNMV